MAMNADPDDAMSPNVTMATNQTDQPLALTPYWPLTFSIPFAVILFVIWFLSFFGNLLVLAVIVRFKGMRTRTNLFIANLALVDFLTAALCMPFSFTTIVMRKWIFDKTVICQINGFLMPLVFITSVHTLMYISLHKCFTITKPFKTVLSKRAVLFMIALAWAVALLLAVVDVYLLNSVEFKHYTTQCGPKYPNDLKGYAHNGIMTVTTYVIPTIVIVYSYTKMFREIVAYSKRLEQHTSVERSSILNTQKKAAWTLLIVVICFLLCWTPYLIYATYGSAVKDKSRIPTWTNPLCYWFGYLNSAVNPIIYGMRNRSFLTGYRSIVCFCWGNVSTPGTDEGSKIFLWSRKRSTGEDPVKQSANSTSSGARSSAKMSDPTLPIVIRKNGKIVRIEEAQNNVRRKRAATVDVVPSTPNNDVITETKNDVVDVKDAIKNDVATQVDDELKNENIEVLCADSGNDSDMSESPRVPSANQIFLNRSYTVNGTKSTDRKKNRLFRSFSRKKDKPEPNQNNSSVDEVKVEFLDLNTRMSKLDCGSFQGNCIAEGASFPSAENLDCDFVVMTKSKGDDLIVRHSTPVRQ